MTTLCVLHALECFSEFSRSIMQFDSLMVGWKVCGAPAEQGLASNFIRMQRDAYIPDLIAASDCMLGIVLP